MTQSTSPNRFLATQPGAQANGTLHGHTPQRFARNLGRFEVDPYSAKRTMLSRMLIACLCLVGPETLPRVVGTLRVPSNCALAADYYLSTAGNDARDGRSPDTAWRTIGRANRQAFGPGDKLLFQGGDAFDGNLVVKVSGSPSAKSPITIGS